MQTTGLSLAQWAEITMRSNRDALFNLCRNKAEYMDGENPPTSLATGCGCGAEKVNPDFPLGILKAIRLAEKRLAQVAGFHFSPMYETAERHSYNGDFGFLNVHGVPKSVFLDMAFVSAFGVIAEDSMATGLITVIDESTHSFSVTYSSPTQPKGEIELRFVSGDVGQYSQVYPAIRPVSVSVVYDDVDAEWDVTVTGDLYSLIKPTVVFGDVCCDETADGATCYAGTVDMVDVYTDMTQQGQMIWNGTGCNGKPCTTESKDACFVLDDFDASIARPHANIVTEVDGELVYTSYGVNHAPVRVSVNYLSGLPLDGTGRVESPFAEAIAFLATSYFAQVGCSVPTCGKCGWCLSDYIQRMTQEPAFETFGIRKGDASELRNKQSLTEDQRNEMPFMPATFGALKAWEIIRSEIRAGKGITI